ncbi:MAG: murein hydrolase activator EnvC [Pseudorhodoplanes sp.]
MPVETRSGCSLSMMRGLLVALALAGLMTEIRAQDAGAPTADVIKLRDRELEAIRAEQRRSAEAERKLREEVEAIGEDRRKLNQALIDSGRRAREAEERLAASEARLRPLADEETTIRASLEGRRAVMAEVLAALQRIGRRPPPALLVRPEDALQGVRTAIMLGAVLPDMRDKAEALAADLAGLTRIRNGIVAEQARMTREMAALAAERERIGLLTEERRKKQAEAEKSLAEERQKALALAQQADDLKDLIGKLEKNLDSATRNARTAARSAEEARSQAEQKPNLTVLKDPGRLAPAIAFASARGLLPLPVNGVRIHEFGASDGLGGTEKGLSIATRAGAPVTAPCDGWVVYSAPYRNYGQLLILNAGGGYHVLLAGMDKISVDLGQFVLTGEPVAIMGRGSQTAANAALGSGQPVLYIEFRKDGIPVDPGPWWAASEGEKVRG